MTDSLERLSSPASIAPSSLSPETAPRSTTGPFVLAWSDETPAALTLPASAFVGRTTAPLVEIFTADEQRARTSQAYVRSSVGERLRAIQGTEEDDGASQVRRVVQRDERTGIEVHTTLTRPHGVPVVRIQSSVRNTSSSSVVLTAATSLSIGFGRCESDLDDARLAIAESEWLAEDRWKEIPLRSVVPALSLPIHAQDGRGHFGLTSHGAWSSGEFVPCGILSSAGTEALAWQIETSAGWHVDISQGAEGGTLALLGPTDLENHFAHEIAPGDSFDTVPVALAYSSEGRDAAVGALTIYRRWLRGHRAEEESPVVYNDFMNTLMGQPSSEQLRPLIASAAAAGADVFCIDAGWFADPAIGDWWNTVGEWREAPTRFTGGLKELTDEILDRGMRVGLWIEPEVVGVRGEAAHTLPEEAFFVRFGRRVQEHERFHLDFRHPAARAHVDEAIDLMIADYGVSYIKLDYNINPGAGTDHDATSAGDGLLGHTRAFRQWLIDLQRRHPGLQLENCSSGAMRADYSLLEVTHQQSTSDQQDFRLYPPIAASAPLSILPEQCANWAYPSSEMSREETVFTLVTGLSGRLYLSGFLQRLSPEQAGLVEEAVTLHKQLRGLLGTAVPFWPAGLPGWDDATIVLGLHTREGDLLFVWDRSDAARAIVVPGVAGQPEQLFPAATKGTLTMGEDGLIVRTPVGVAARVILVRPDDVEA